MFGSLSQELLFLPPVLLHRRKPLKPCGGAGWCWGPQTDEFPSTWPTMSRCPKSPEKPHNLSFIGVNSSHFQLDQQSEAIARRLRLEEFGSISTGLRPIEVQRQGGPTMAPLNAQLVVEERVQVTLWLVVVGCFFFISWNSMEKHFQSIWGGKHNQIDSSNFHMPGLQKALGSETAARRPLPGSGFDGWCTLSVWLSLQECQICAPRFRSTVYSEWTRKG